MQKERGGMQRKKRKFPQVRLHHPALPLVNCPDARVATLWVSTKPLILTILLTPSLHKYHLFCITALDFNQNGAVVPVPPDHQGFSVCFVPSKAVNMIGLNLSKVLTRFQGMLIKPFSFILRTLRTWYNLLVSQGLGNELRASAIEVASPLLFPSWFVDLALVVEVFENLGPSVADYTAIQDYITRLGSISIGAARSLELAKKKLVDLERSLCKIESSTKMSCFAEDTERPWNKVLLEPLPDSSYKLLTFQSYVYSVQIPAECGVEATKVSGGLRPPLRRLSSDCCLALYKNDPKALDVCPAREILPSIYYHNYQTENAIFYTTKPSEGCNRQILDFAFITDCDIYQGDPHELTIFGSGANLEVFQEKPDYAVEPTDVFSIVAISVCSVLTFVTLAITVSCIAQKCLEGSCVCCSKVDNDVEMIERKCRHVRADSLVGSLMRERNSHALVPTAPLMHS